MLFKILIVAGKFILTNIIINQAVSKVILPALTREVTKQYFNYVNPVRHFK
jgi:hypothetical protein